AVIPHFYRGAAVAGEVFEGGLLLETSFGRGFISCRLGDEWSSPGAVTITGGSRAVQIGENIDVVILWINKQAPPQLSHDFTVDLAALSASANGNSARTYQEIKILVLGGNGKTCGSDLNGAVLQPDDSVNKALYGKFFNSAEFAVGGVPTPARAQPLVS